MFGEIIPVIDVIKANKRLKVKNKAESIEIPEKIGDIDIKYLEEEYKNAIEAKNRFEDKAKTIVAALTIAITLILNLSKIIETISDRFQSSTVNILIFVLAGLAIIYMLIAGIMAIQVLIKENLLFTISLLDRTKQDKKCIFITTQQNVNQNLIRNNIIYSAYRSIRNSVLCLVIIFILAILPSQHSPNSDVENEDVMTNENVCFSMETINWLNENTNRKISFDKIIDMYASGSDENVTKNIYDKEEKIIVTTKKVDDLYVIDNIIGNIEGIE